MDRKEATELVNFAIDELIKNDLMLLDVDVAERSLSFKLAHYMSMSGLIHYPLTVDCEYNRHFSDPKRLLISPDPQPLVA